MIILIVAQKAFEKIQCHFMIKKNTLCKTRIEGYCIHLKSLFAKNNDSKYFSTCELLNEFLSKWEQEDKNASNYSIYSTLYQRF